MSKEKRPSQAEFWVDEPPPQVELPKLESTAPIASPSIEVPGASPKIAVAGVQSELVISNDLPDLDDPSVLLRQLTGNLAAIHGGPMTGEQLAQQAEIERHNAHVTAEDLIRNERRRQKKQERRK